MGKAAPWSQIVMKMLSEADGPLLFDDVRAEVAKAVPEERALRIVAQEYEGHLNRRKSTPQPARRRSREKHILSGQRRVALWSIRNMINNGVLTLFEKDGERYVQLASRRQRPPKKDSKPWTLRGWAMVDKGPISLAVLEGELWTMVPPGQGWRYTEQQRTRQSRRPGAALPPSERAQARTDEELQELGARTMVRRTFLTYVRKGKMVLREVNGIPYIAMKEDQDKLDALAQPAPDSSADELEKELVEAVQRQPDGTLLRLATRIRRVAGQVEEWDPFGAGKNGEVPGVVAELRQLAAAIERHASRSSADVAE